MMKKRLIFQLRQRNTLVAILDELIAWEDKLPTWRESICDWDIPTGEILDSFDDSQSDDETYDDAESYVEIPDILTSMEYLSKVKNFVLHKSYTNVLPDKTAVEEKLEYIFLKEKHSACQIASTDYFEYKWMTSVCNLSF